MMKSALFIGSLLALSPLSHALDKTDVVLGVSLDMSVRPYHFPCTAYLSVVFCGGDVRLKDAVCERSLEFMPVGRKSMNVSCTTSEMKKVVLAHVQGEFVNDVTQDAFGFVPTELTPEGNALIEIKK